jgi:hypothetical protein
MTIHNSFPKIGTETKDHSFEYGTVRVKDLSAETVPVLQRSRKSRLESVNAVNTLFVDGRPTIPTKRFWTSLQVRFGFSGNIFRYFDHAEVFNRVSSRSADDVIRYCIEKDPNNKDGKDQLLAVTNPLSTCVHYDTLKNLLGEYNAKGLTYANGLVRSIHVPKIGNVEFNILGDAFSNQFAIDTPIDGFGRPNIYLSLLRQICSNGAIGYGQAFRSEVAVGGKTDDVSFALARAMDGFNNEEGFAAMRERFEKAGRSWASVSETQKLYKLLSRIGYDGNLEKIGREFIPTADGGGHMHETALPIFHKYHKLTGDVSGIYGMANLDALSVKRQRTLPVACTVYDMLNFVSEVATHMAKADGARKLQAFIGETISTEYDLEGTKDQFGDYRDFFVSDAAAIETQKVMHNNIRNY